MSALPSLVPRSSGSKRLASAIDRLVLSVDAGRPFGLNKCRRLKVLAEEGTDGGGKDSKHAGGVWGPGDYDPEFSPDGRYLTFQRATDALLLPGNVSSHDAMRIKLDGTELRRLSPPGNKAIHAIPDWSDDDRVVFTEWNSIDRYVGPVIVHADGSNYQRVTSLEGGTWVRWIPSTRKSRNP